jgi:hypothetical protein
MEEIKMASHETYYIISCFNEILIKNVHVQACNGLSDVINELYSVVRNV